MAIVYGVAGVLQLFARPIAGQRKQKEKVKYSVVFHHAPLMCLIGFQLMSSLGSSFGSYYSIYFRYTLGAPSELLSWMTVVGALSELPFFWYANRIERRIGTQNFMTIAVSATVLKMILLSFVTNPYIVLLLQVLGGMSVVGNSYSILKYINDVVPKQMRTTAMMVNAIVVTIFSSVVCSPLVVYWMHNWHTDGACCRCSRFDQCSDFVLSIFPSSSESSAEKRSNAQSGDWREYYSCRRIRKTQNTKD